MFYTGRGIAPKKASVLRALIFAGWCPKPDASNASDNLMVFVKNRYRININRKHGFEFMKPQGDRWERVVKCQLRGIKFDTRHNYTIHITSTRFVDFTINLLHPEQYVKGGSEELETALKKCQSFLMKYAHKNGKFPTRTELKHWIMRNLTATYQVTDFIYKQGQDTHWVGVLDGSRNIVGRRGMKIVPVFNGEKRGSNRKTEK